MRRIYGVTAVEGSPRIMPYPPEAFYRPLGGNTHGEPSHDWIGRQLAEDLTVEGLIDSPEMGDRVRLIEIPGLTERQAGRGAPSYGVMVRGKDGVLQMLRDKNHQPRNWRPDFGLAVQAEIAKANDDRSAYRRSVRGILGPLGTVAAIAEMGARVGSEAPQRAVPSVAYPTAEATAESIAKGRGGAPGVAANIAAGSAEDLKETLSNFSITDLAPSAAVNLGVQGGERAGRPDRSGLGE